MTDLLTAAKQALEALSAAENHYDSAEKWRSHFAAKDALRQAIEQTERGTKAWADVPNASKWVDELRGGLEEPPNSDTDVVESENCYGDGNVYRGERSKDSDTFTVNFKSCEKNT